MCTFSFKNKLQVVIFCFYLVDLLDSKMADDETKKAEGNPIKNFTAHENTLAPRPQTSSLQPLKQLECKVSKCKVESY